MKPANPSRHDFTVACICPMGVELAPLQAMLDTIYPDLFAQHDYSNYILGELSGHKVVIAVLPETGTNAAATVANQIQNDFPSIAFGLLVGIGGGVPDEEEEEPGCGNDIRLGDVVVSKPTANFGGVIQYDLGKHTTNGGFQRTGLLNKPPRPLRSAVERLAADHRMKGSQVPRLLQEMIHRYPMMEEDYSYPGAPNDQLFQKDYVHQSGASCRRCDKSFLVDRVQRRNDHPKFHYGTIGSANAVVRDANLRDRLRRELNIICVEMEAASLMDSFPCLVIRGICDYADSHKSKRWQPYAAAVAAAYAKELLSVIPPKEIAQASHTHDIAAKQDTALRLGLRLGQAPIIDSQAFVGREIEMNTLLLWLMPGLDDKQSIVSIVGMGGLGKTQLSLAFARQNATHFTSVIWLRANDRSTLEQDVIEFNKMVLEEGSNDGNQSPIEAFRRCLALPENRDWLLILDNYDDPDIPGARSATGHDIQDIIPKCNHGSILITTRSPRLGFSRQLTLPKLGSLEHATFILSQRSGRALSQDESAYRLAKRLDGLPLALAIAGTYLGQTSMSAEDYLAEYESAWPDLHDVELFDYQDRTMISTWSLSIKQIESRNPLSVEILQIFAYLSNDDIWYDLIKAGAQTGGPLWMKEVTTSRSKFEKAMVVLGDYNLVLRSDRGYSIHPCLHDWLTAKFTSPPMESLFFAAINGVLASLPNRFPSGYEVYLPEFEMMEKRLLQHIRWLQKPRFESFWDLSIQDTDKAVRIGDLFSRTGDFESAYQVLSSALVKREECYGFEDPSSIATAASLAFVAGALGMSAESRMLYERAYGVRKRTVGPHHIDTIRTAYNIGIAYIREAKLDEARAVLKQAYDGFGRSRVEDDSLRIFTGLWHEYLCDSSGNLEGIQAALEHLLRESEKLAGPGNPEHPCIHRSALFLNQIYLRQQRFAEADMLVQRCLGYPEGITLVGFNSLRASQSLGSWLDVSKMPLLARTVCSDSIVALEASFGDKHFLTLDAYAQLARLLDKEGPESEYAALLHKALFAVHQILEEGAPPDKMSVLPMAHILQHCIRSGIPSTRYRQSHLLDIIGLHQQHDGEPSLIYQVSRSLLCLEDDREARAAIAILLAPTEDERQLLTNGSYILCDGCDDPVLAPSVIFSCKTCFGVDLCSSCVRSYEAGKKIANMQRCSKHRFLRLDLSVDRTTTRLIQTRKELDMWLDALHQKYSDDLDRTDTRNEQIALLRHHPVDAPAAAP